MTATRIRGYVLAGGESSRMQRPDLPRDKALLVLGSETLLERALATLSAICPYPLILCGGAERCDRFRHLGPTVPDHVMLAGPLGGLHAALWDARQQRAAWVLVTPVDLPWMSVAVLRSFMVRALASGAGAVCLRAANTVQPLPLLLSTAAEPFLLAALHAGERKLRPVLRNLGQQCGDRTGLHLIEIESLEPSAGTAEVCFRNLNTPEEFQAAQQDETLRIGLHQSKHGG